MTRWLRIVALVVASLVFSLLLAEGVLRVIGFHFDVAPERIEFGWPDPVTIVDRFERDVDLFWVSQDYREKLARLAEDPPEILFLGDSCTELGGYPALLVERLRERYPLLEIQGGNLAVSGWSSYQGLRQFERDVLPLAPKVVTIYFGWNDHWFGFGVEDKEIPTVTLSRFPRLRSFRVVQLLLRTELAGRSLERKNLPERVTPQDFRANLQAIARLARDNGIIPVFLTAPSSHERGHEPEHLESRFVRSLDELVPLHQRYVSIVREVAEAEEGAVLCDLAAGFEALPPADLRKLYFTEDGIHLKPLGSHKVADFLFECLEREPRLRETWGRR